MHEGARARRGAEGAAAGKGRWQVSRPTDLKGPQPGAEAVEKPLPALRVAKLVPAAARRRQLLGQSAALLGALLAAVTAPLLRRGEGEGGAVIPAAVLEEPVEEGHKKEFEALREGLHHAEK